jgi:hypothetical protein
LFNILDQSGREALGDTFVVRIAASNTDSVEWIGVPPMSIHQNIVTGYIASLPSPQKEICRSLRKLILEGIPQMNQEFKWHRPAYYCNGKRICLVSSSKDHVTLELFYGAHLRDVEGRIVGLGKNTRHIKIKSLDEIGTNYYVDLLQQSIELSQ